MTLSISSLSRQLQLNNALLNEQSNLADLNQQLASNQQYSNLTDYSPTQAKQLISLQNSLVQRNSYLGSITTVQARLSTYDTTLSDMETITSQAQALASQNQTYNASTASNIGAQAVSYMQQTADDLNQKVGDRYIYAGTRYSTTPVIDPSTLTTAPSATPTTAPALPEYDTEYQAGTHSDPNASVKDSVNIDSNYNVTYGVTSTDPSFQNLISGLRFMNSAVTAGKAGDTATYQSDMQQASTLLNNALTGIQTIHAGVASNQNILTSETTTQNTNITNLQNQLGDIQNVNLTTVSTEINLLQTQMQASYSATASFEQLSLVKYL